MMVTITMSVSFAQNGEQEESSPSTDTEIVRRCSLIDIEGKCYEKVTVTLKSTSPDYFISDNLYIFNNGQIQMGKPKFNQIVISRDGDQWYGAIKEKEGVFFNGEGKI